MAALLSCTPQLEAESYWVGKSLTGGGIMSKLFKSPKRTNVDMSRV